MIILRAVLNPSPLSVIRRSVHYCDVCTERVRTKPKTGSNVFVLKILVINFFFSFPSNITRTFYENNGRKNHSPATRWFCRALDGIRAFPGIIRSTYTECALRRSFPRRLRLGFPVDIRTIDPGMQWRPAKHVHGNGFNKTITRARESGVCGMFGERWSSVENPTRHRGSPRRRDAFSPSVRCTSSMISIYSRMAKWCIVL